MGQSWIATKKLLCLGSIIFPRFYFEKRKFNYIVSWQFFNFKSDKAISASSKTS
jgi:hypothetical protein